MSKSKKRRKRRRKRRAPIARREPAPATGYVTINGVRSPSRVTISRTDGNAERIRGLADALAITTTIRSDEPEPLLLDLAWLAVVTPSLDADDALEVLADALLERGLLREPDPPIESVLTLIGESGGLIPSVREQAWTWAREHTMPPLLERLRRLASPSPTIADLFLERDASARDFWLSIREREPPP